MRSGLENTTESALIKIIGNLKSGVFSVVNMGPAALVSDNPKECPPVAAFETNLTILQAFKRECLRRGMDYDAIAPDIREIERMWLNARE